MELVSVIIPYFRKKKYITETISSVLKQTYENLEVIVVYDDETKVDLDFINNLKNNDSRIKIITNPLNLGAGECRNIGITNAKGSYIAFVDADDIWDEKKIELQLSYMMSNNYSFPHTSYKIINSDNSFTYIIPLVSSGGAEVRIIGKKNGKKVIELIFKVKVGK